MGGTTAEHELKSSVMYRLSAADNPNIRDTSDRERLVSCREVAEFKGILKVIVSRLEKKRSEDHDKRGTGESRCDGLFEELSADGLFENVKSLSDK